MNTYIQLKPTIISSILVGLTSIVLLISCDNEDVNEVVSREGQTFVAGIADGLTTTVFEDEGEAISVPFSVGFTLNESANVTIDLTLENAVYGVDFVTEPDGASGQISLSISAGSNNPTIRLIPNVTEEVKDYSVMFEVSGVSGGLRLAEGSGVFTASVEDRTKNLDIIAFTSFEEPTAGATNNYEADDGVEQINKDGLNSVDYVSTGDELGFDFSYIPGEEGGEDTSLYWGVTNVLNEPDEWDLPFFQDGMQAYVASDADGLAEIVFDEVTIAPSTEILLVTLSTFFVDASWEDSDEFDVFWRTSDGDELLLSFRGDENDDMRDQPDGTGNVIENSWVTFNAFVQNVKTGRLVLQIGNNSGSELVFLDAIRIGVK
ncbi:hypothetical protein [Allomuricauda sp. SCSIO 65647]|uniref:hypothetical protein n=1 Tax=Allomuricauda sp. SCSIO 65647 TaxID=2908843 RepID=UPI001F3CB998|nr:hypothetical protein [Muricauda sp. SCSIO 65647]UJH68569.1 hypothetical protein L0P89_04995 [Muricauda sp. SCSIO 65647]